MRQFCRSRGEEWSMLPHAKVSKWLTKGITTIILWFSGNPPHQSEATSVLSNDATLTPIVTCMHLSCTHGFEEHMITNAVNTTFIHVFRSFQSF